MKKILFTLAITLLFLFQINAQQAYKMRLLDNWNNPGLATNPDMEDQIWNELTGWVDTATGAEFIIMGSIDSIYFFDVTDPTNIKLCDVEWGINRAINRDVEVYGNYLYTVSDNSQQRGKLQIFDLRYLPDSVHKVFESDTFGHLTHSMMINPASKRLYLCANRQGNRIVAMTVLSIDTPDMPSYLGELQIMPFACERVHEVHMRGDTAFCSCEYKGLFVYDLTDLNNQRLLGSITPPYPYNGYNHTNWTDSAIHHIAFTDELPLGLPLKIYRIRSFDDMTYLSHFNTNPGATPHNLFWVGNILYVSWYHDGVYMLDVSNPRHPKVHAYYDTYPQNQQGEYGGFKGCWGVFPYFPSGNIAASDMQNGLFMLRFDSTITTNVPKVNIEDLISVFPNPTKVELYVQFDAPYAENCIIRICDVQGRLMHEYKTELWVGPNMLRFDAFSELNKGVYLLSLETDSGLSYRKKVLKH